MLLTGPQARQLSQSYHHSVLSPLRICARQKESLPFRLKPRTNTPDWTDTRGHSYEGNLTSAKCCHLRLSVGRCSPRINTVTEFTRRLLGIYNPHGRVEWCDTYWHLPSRPPQPTGSWALCLQWRPSATRWIFGCICGQFEYVARAVFYINIPSLTK